MTTPALPRFNGMLTARVREAPPRALPPGECQTQGGEVCALCHASRLSYTEELEAKQAALSQFADTALVGARFEPLVPSSQGRAYRTTTKRKLFRTRRGIDLGLIEPDDEGRLRALTIQNCVIEPPIHTLIYRLVGEFLASSSGSPLAELLRHVVIRGGSAEQTLILTVGALTGPLIRSANRLSKTLTGRVPTIVGAFLFEDTTRGSHYLGTRGAGAQPTVRKLYGKPELFMRVLGRPFLFSPFVFSQVNSFLLERMILTVAELLEPDPRGTLYDLYCGYGLFALSLSDRVHSVFGVEVSALSVTAARRNAERQRVSNARFQVAEITKERIDSLLRRLGASDRVLLDPPRSGAGPGVLEAAAARRPHRVVHLVCNIDLLPRELRRWTEAGYRLVKATPLDMFPGTSTIETVVALQPA